MRSGRCAEQSSHNPGLRFLRDLIHCPCTAMSATNDQKVRSFHNEAFSCLQRHGRFRLRKEGGEEANREVRGCLRKNGRVLSLSALLISRAHNLCVRWIFMPSSLASLYFAVQDQSITIGAFFALLLYSPSPHDSQSSCSSFFAVHRLVGARLVRLVYRTLVSF